MKDRIEVSPEMVTFVGAGPIDDQAWPDNPVLFSFDEQAGGLATVSLLTNFEVADAEQSSLVFLIAAAACDRLFPSARVADGRWHLTLELRAMAAAIRGGQGTKESRSTLRLAKSIELFWGVLTLLENGTALPADGDGTLTASESKRVMAAHAMIQEHWHERLTLNTIARAVGMSRAQLTRGYRIMFKRTVGDAVEESRLGNARSLLLRTELSISSIGYRCGYMNNASFSRAFARHYGVPPSQMRKSVQ